MFIKVGQFKALCNTDGDKQTNSYKVVKDTSLGAVSQWANDTISVFEVT
jgi:hypothetical protein